MGGVGDFKGGLDSDAVVVSKRAREAPAYQRQSRKASVKYVQQHGSPCSAAFTPVLVPLRISSALAAQRDGH
eukprot:5702-Heterococcus_DN1.PRE.2